MLDGSGSKGEIERYRWKVRPLGLGGGVTARHDGPRFSFRILDPVLATLEVFGGEERDQSSVVIDVAPRRWETKSEHREPERSVNQPFTSDEKYFGQSLCALGDGEETGDKLHRDHARGATWDEVGYRLGRVDDEGPYRGMWYVESHDLKLDRQTWINSKLLPPEGEVYKENVAKGNKVEMDRLLRQIRTHERMHTTLMERELRKGTGADPARRIEVVWDSDRGSVKDRADTIIREVETALAAATEERKVHDELRKVEEFRRGGTIRLPGGGEAKFASFATIGDRE